MAHIDFDLMVSCDRDDFFAHAAKGRSEADMELIRQAYYLAEEAHRPQKRQSSEPFIIHPIAVARIVCCELQLGTNPIVAALLHDVVEDTHYTVEDIRERFGEDIAFLVKVVTKEKKKHYEMSKQLDNFRQMLNSIHYDIRALLIKLADRLHNMRTLDSMKAEKQMKTAGETDYFYAPLANRLGLYEMKSELENLSFRYRSPKEYARIEKQLNRYMEREKESITAFCQPIRQLLEQQGIPAQVFPKFRSPYSIWRKKLSTGKNFHHLEHKHVIKVVFSERPDSSEKDQCLGIYSLITDLYKEKPASLTNYVNAPKENGYQSLHFKVMCNNGSWVEVQVGSERMAYNARMGCIVERATGIDKWIEKFKSVLQDIAYHSKEGGFIENVVTSFYRDDIIVFTPKGNSIILPKGATALDLAYEIHSDIGNHAKFARINGKLSSVKTTLRRGDRVEIGKDESTTPRPDWLDVAITYKAKKNISSALRKMEAEQTTPLRCYCSVCRPIPGDEVVGFLDPDKRVTIHKRNCMEAICLAAKSGESIVEVDFPVTSTLYPVQLRILAVDRPNLIMDFVSVISNELRLSITNLTTTTHDEIVNCIIDFSVHSADELNAIISHVSKIKSVEEVS